MGGCMNKPKVSESISPIKSCTLSKRSDSKPSSKFARLYSEENKAHLEIEKSQFEREVELSSSIDSIPNIQDLIEDAQGRIILEEEKESSPKSCPNSPASRNIEKQILRNFVPSESDQEESKDEVIVLTDSEISSELELPIFSERDGKTPSPRLKDCYSTRSTKGVFDWKEAKQIKPHSIDCDSCQDCKEQEENNQAKGSQIEFEVKREPVPDPSIEEAALLQFRERISIIRENVLFDKPLPDNFEGSSILVDSRNAIRKELGLEEKKNLEKAYKILDVVESQKLFVHYKNFDFYTENPYRRIKNSTAYPSDLCFSTHEENRECAICTEEFETKDILMKLFPCSHNFHAECIERSLYYSTKCPLCRIKIEEFLFEDL